jgi:hypothetical protein
MTTRPATTPRRHLTFRKDPHVHHIALQLANFEERKSFHRAIRDADRAAIVSEWLIHGADRAAIVSERSIRRQFGESLVRLGRRVGGETLATPEWQG